MNRFRLAAGASAYARRLSRGAVCACLSIALAFTLCTPAFAEVLSTDEILGTSVADLGVDESVCPDVTSDYVLLIGSDGTVYFSRDADAEVKIASITKVMTAIVALEYGDLDMEVTVDSEAATVGESSAGLTEGDTMTLETALYALMIPSGNDAAIAIAKAVGALLEGGDTDPYGAFVDAMNDMAAELGCTNTVYTNPHGLDTGEFADENCYSTATDVGIVVAYAMQNETFRSIVACGDTTIQVDNSYYGTRSITLTATDELIGVYEGVIGVKTGYTGDAGYCFAGAVNRSAGEFYSVVLNSPDSDTRFIDTTTLYDWVYEYLTTYTLINVESYVESSDGSSVPLVAEVAHTGWVNKTVAATVADSSLSITTLSLLGTLEQSVEYETLTGKVSAGDVVGHITYTLNGETVAQVDLVAIEDVSGPNIVQKLGIWLKRLVLNAQGNATQATSVCYTTTTGLSDR